MEEEGAGVADANIVHQHADAASRGGGLQLCLDALVQALRLGKVRDDRNDLALGLARNLRLSRLELLRAAADDHDVQTALRQFGCVCLADAVRCTRHNCPLAVRADLALGRGGHKTKNRAEDAQCNPRCREETQHKDGIGGIKLAKLERGELATDGTELLVHLVGWLHQVSASTGEFAQGTPATLRGL